MAVTDSVGIVAASSTPPELLADLALLAEDLGFGELWIPEDYWCLGSIASLTRMLSVTERIRIGTGVMSVLVRHPSVVAMEFGALERMFPGRVMAGLGLGVPEIVSVMGYRAASPIRTIRESVDILRTLLSGAEYTAEGTAFQARGIKLHHPPATVPPIYTGVLGPKMVQLSGEIADGTVVSAMASPAYLRWLRQHIATGQARRPGGGPPHRVPCFAMYCVDSDAAAARAQARPLVALYLSVLSHSPLVTANPFAAEVAELVARGGDRAAALLEKEMPDEWLDQLTVTGDPATCARRIDDLLEAGADSVVLMPLRDQGLEDTLRMTAESVLPLVGAPVTA